MDSLDAFESSYTQLLGDLHLPQHKLVEEPAFTYTGLPQLNHCLHVASQGELRVHLLPKAHLLSDVAALPEHIINLSLDRLPH